MNHAHPVIGVDCPLLPGVTARLSLAMPDGSPLCAAVRPPAVEWSEQSEDRFLTSPGRS